VETASENRQGTELAKAYDHREVEPRWYRFWMEKGYFHADEKSKKPPFSIVLPPPNITGSLHLGHALTATLQDILIRWKRMSGFNAMWLPGTDHAGIATQMIVEKELQKTEKKSRHDLGRAEFLKRVWAWKEKYGSRIGEQHQALGASLDWPRERFTMDEGLTRAVREVFVRLHDEGLIYRERKLINWCPRCRTALSDLEVNHEEGHKGELWSFAYPLTDPMGATTEIVVATTRPETMLGDTAVAVHPEDPRYRALVGRTVTHPLNGKRIPIIGDAVLVDPRFGTGAVKVTPAHDFNDFEVGKRHHLPMLNILEPDGTLNAQAGPLAGLDRFEARSEVKRLIAEKGLERGAQPHVMALGRCQRCETVLEPLLSYQWFVKVEPMARSAIAAVEKGKTRFVPEQWTNTYMAWMTNIHDWCISRQLWWGHQIPAWYCPEGHVTVAREAPERCGDCGQSSLRQDEDVLDTWFSSGLWPFSTLGWPEKTKSLQAFYPTSVMETGHDIIFFWVARMMMLGTHFMKDVPFRTVFLHAMVRDEKGQKMSKTKGNVIDPLDITSQFGADALRFTLAALTAQGRDIKLAKDRIDGYRAFCNKIWNATRFALMNLKGFRAKAPGPSEVAKVAHTPADTWILARLQRAVNETLDALEAFKFNEAANAVYQFVWHELCDWYIELSKEALLGEGAPRKAAQTVLSYCLESSLRLLHPMMPFVTEELWQTLKEAIGPASPAARSESIMVAPYPKRGVVDEAAEGRFQPVVGIIEAIRAIRGEMNIPPKAEVVAAVAVHDADAAAVVTGEATRIRWLTRAELAVIRAPNTPPAPATAVGVGPGFEVRVLLAGAIDFAAEGARIDKELARIQGDLDGLEKKLENPNFVARAPAEVVEKDRARVEELKQGREKLGAHRKALAAGTNGAPSGGEAREVFERAIEEALERARSAGAKPAKAPALTASSPKGARKAAPARAKKAKAASKPKTGGRGKGRK
jgi:valyl-tRNA synthetase